MPLQGLPAKGNWALLFGESQGRGTAPRWCCCGYGWSWCSWLRLLSLVEAICSSEPSRRMKSDQMTWRKGSRGSRMRSAASGEHRTGEDEGEAFTLAPG